MAEITVPLYKVLVDGSSCHGGDMAWPLPTQAEDGAWTPGEWVKLHGRRKLVLCANALHLTDQPAAWYMPNAQCWLAEYRGEVVGELDGGWQSKIGVREARLLRPVAWEDVCVWTEGEHTVKSGVARASGSASVTAYDRASVRASGSASVTASGSASVTASGSASVTASGSVSVTASDRASVTASDRASVTASGSATVISTPWHSDSAQVAISQMAAHVDRRGGKLALRAAEAAWRTPKSPCT